ncbi:MAG: Holliday junction resolvase RuvX [Acidimicrobiales bacterium]
MARVLGLDPGTVRCGVAVSDTARTMAFPRPALTNDETMIARLRAMIDDEEVAVLVVGRPVALRGNATRSTVFADALFAQLQEVFAELRVLQCDERLTTVQAQRSLSHAGVKTKDQRQHIDSASAVIMLQHFLDGSRAP